MTLTDKEQSKAWAMAGALRDMIEDDPKSFEIVLPCILAHWILKMDVSAEKLSAEITEALRQQQAQTAAAYGVRN